MLKQIHAFPAILRTRYDPLFNGDTSRKLRQTRQVLVSEHAPAGCKSLPDKLLGILGVNPISLTGKSSREHESSIIGTTLRQ